MIYLTEKAISKIKEILLAEDIEHNSIRVKVIGGGCASFKYDIMFDDMVKDLDEVFNDSGVQIICDQLSLTYLDEVLIDFIEGEMESGFKFINNKAKSTCGCGSSFSV